MLVVVPNLFLQSLHLLQSTFLPRAVVVSIEHLRQLVNAFSIGDETLVLRSNVTIICRAQIPMLLGLRGCRLDCWFGRSSWFGWSSWLDCGTRGLFYGEGIFLCFFLRQSAFLLLLLLHLMNLRTDCNLLRMQGCNLVLQLLNLRCLGLLSLVFRCFLRLALHLPPPCFGVVELRHRDVNCVNLGLDCLFPASSVRFDLLQLLVELGLLFLGAYYPFCLLLCFHQLLNICVSLVLDCVYCIEGSLLFVLQFLHRLDFGSLDLLRILRLHIVQLHRKRLLGRSLPRIFIPAVSSARQALVILRLSRRRCLGKLYAVSFQLSCMSCFQRQCSVDGCQFWIFSLQIFGEQDVV
mmetsp:Transcript_36828/g.86656  ORF Transcript_36828/g.86656 Transcript_36828/m.86656 type:complete len:350 (-) Transcript_36828:210-1259(-)